MKNSIWLILIIILTITIACSSGQGQEVDPKILTSVAETLSAQPIIQSTDLPQMPETIVVPPVPVTPSIENSSTPPPTNPANPQSSLDCSGILIGEIVTPVTRKEDLFEHHALGTFIYFELQITNLTSQSIRIWDEDYSLETLMDGELVKVSPDKEATNYLYITQGASFFQADIKPYSSLTAYLAFDIDPELSQWELILTPGSELNNPFCSLRLFISE